MILYTTGLTNNDNQTVKRSPLAACFRLRVHCSEYCNVYLSTALYRILFYQRNGKYNEQTTTGSVCHIYRLVHKHVLILREGNGISIKILF